MTIPECWPTRPEFGLEPHRRAFGLALGQPPSVRDWLGCATPKASLRMARDGMTSRCSSRANPRRLGVPAPRRGFEREPGGTQHGGVCERHRLARLEPVRVAVGPEDFPSLGRVHAYDDDAIAASIEPYPDAFPWLE